MRIGTARMRISGVLAALPVNVVKLLRFQVERFELIVRNGPSRGDPAEMANLAKIFLAKAEERGAVEFGVASDVVVRVRMERLAVLIAPLFLSLVLAFDIDGAGIPIGLLPAHVISALENQNAFSCGSKRMHQCSASCSGSDDDYVVVLVLSHSVCLHCNNSNRTYSVVPKVFGF